jgi:Family of unknown function (DUF6527)
MRSEKATRHVFVRSVPETLDADVLYISTEFALAIHLCCCGCGFEVVTPLSPTDWKVIFDGETVSLYPSIDNSNFDCQSHYWIRNDRVIWATKWTANKIAAEQSRERREHSTYLDGADSPELKSDRRSWWRRTFQS